MTDVPSCTVVGSGVTVSIAEHPFSERHSPSVARLPCNGPPPSKGTDVSATPCMATTATGTEERQEPLTLVGIAATTGAIATNVSAASHARRWLNMPPLD